MIVVLAPEVAWCGKGDLRDRMRPGDEFDVQVLRYNYQTRELVGSIRRLHPEQNPYRHLSRLEPGTILQGRVSGVYHDGATVRLPNGARGDLPKHRFGSRDLKAGDEVGVTIAALEVDEGRLTLDLAPQESGSPNQSAAAVLTEMPA